MNPGPVESAEKVAESFIDSLKREPLSLALVVMNLALLIFFWTILSAVAKQRETEVKLIYDDKRQMAELLSRCVVPERRTELIPLPRPKPKIEENDALKEVHP